MTTLAALCFVAGLDIQECTATEFARCWDVDVMAKIRAKQALKPKASPLPGPTEIDWEAEREAFHLRYPMPGGVVMYHNARGRDDGYGYVNIGHINAAIAHDKLWAGWAACVEAHQ